MKNIKVFLFFFFLVVFSKNAYGVFVSFSKARLVAEHKLIIDSKEDFSIKNTIVLHIKKDTIAYVFNLSPRGYIVVCANDELVPVIAYAYENNSYIEAEEYNPLFRLIINDLRERIKILKKASYTMPEIRQLWYRYIYNDTEPKNNFQQWPPEGSTPTGGWLQENWSQGSPYNDMCPIDPLDGERSVAGCPAIAMSQILNFQKNLNNTLFSDGDDYYHSYGGRNYWIDNDHETYDFPSWEELNEYLDTLEQKYNEKRPINNTDKAALVYACGVAAHQVFTSSVSGTFGISQAYDAYKRFGFNTCKLMDTTDADLFEKLSENMKNGMPAHMGIVDSIPQYGHNVVVDGYNTDDCYHLNFGWGGAYNGWYSFPLTGMPYGMNYIEGVILDIGEPHHAVEECEEEMRLKVINGTLSFTLPYEAYVEIMVFDVAGQKRVFRASEKQKGKYTFEIEEGSGLFFVLIKVNGMIYKKRVMIIRN